MKPIDVFYSLGWQTIRPLLWIAGWFSPKIRSAVEGRLDAVENMEAWAADRAAAAEPLLWLHGASAGELAGAAPVIEVLRNRRPRMQIAVTYSSPSGEGVARRLRPHYRGYAPLETRTDTVAAVRAMDPAVLVYAKLDVWPGLTLAARDAGVPIALVNATVRSDSSRLHQPTRGLMEDSYASLEAVGAVSEAERSRLVELGVHPDVIRVTGDAAFDQAVARVERARNGAGGRPHRLPPSRPGILRLVAGSTWAADEAFLVEAVGKMRGGDRLELVLVPHEPMPRAVERLCERIRLALGREARVYSRRETWTDLVEEPPPPVIVDAVGFLAELYLEADVAYVGGGLDGTGLHSVIEPAAAGRPVLFGGRHDRWDAAELVAAGGAYEVDATNVALHLEALLDDEFRGRMGERAEAYVRSRLGAAEASADLIEPLLESRS